MAGPRNVCANHFADLLQAEIINLDTYRAASRLVHGRRWQPPHKRIASWDGRGDEWIAARAG